MLAKLDMKTFNPSLFVTRFKIVLGYLEEGSGDFAETAIADLVIDLQTVLVALRTEDNFPSRADFIACANGLLFLRQTEKALRSGGPMYAARVARRALARWDGEKLAEFKDGAGG
jgi:hypothetical protein